MQRRPAGLDLAHRGRAYFNQEPCNVIFSIRNQYDLTVGTLKNYQILIAYLWLIVFD